MTTFTQPQFQPRSDKLIRVAATLREGPVCVCYADESGGIGWYDGNLSDGKLDFHDNTPPIPYDSSKDEGIPGIFAPFVKINPKAIVIHMAHFKPKPQMPERFAILYANGDDTLWVTGVRAQCFARPPF